MQRETRCYQIWAEAYDRSALAAICLKPRSQPCSIADGIVVFLRFLLPIPSFPTSLPTSRSPDTKG